MNRKEPVVFENSSGYKLFGTWHTPKVPDANLPVIVLLSPGIKMRVGPHRLYNRMTEAFTELGFCVFKFDFFGLGDSEGELEHEFLHEIYRDTESGRFVADSKSALDWVETNKGVGEFVLAGLCGGAITGLLLAEVDSRVKGLISLAITVTLSGNAQDRARNASQSELQALRGGYLRKLFKAESWIRLITAKSDFRSILRSIASGLPHRGTAPAPKAVTETIASSADSNTNPKFPAAFFSVLESGRRMMLVFSSADRTYWDYKEKFAARYVDKIEALSDKFELHIIEHANHVFSFREWEKEMLVPVIDWLSASYRTPGSLQAE